MTGELGFLKSGDFIVCISFPRKSESMELFQCYVHRENRLCDEKCVLLSTVIQSSDTIAFKLFSAHSNINLQQS